MNPFTERILKSAPCLPAHRFQIVDEQGNVYVTFANETIAIRFTNDRDTIVMTISTRDPEEPWLKAFLVHEALMGERLWPTCKIGRQWRRLRMEEAGPIVCRILPGLISPVSFRWPGVKELAAELLEEMNRSGEIPSS